jgi:chromosome segregation ATPase
LGETLNEGEKHLKTGEIGEKRVEIEVIKEIRVEVPVEVIKEVPVEVIKEVEKIIYTSDDTQVNELLSKIEKLNEEISIKTTEIGRIRGEFSNKTEEMENIFQNKMSKKDEELDEFRQKLDILVTNDKTNMLQETLQNLRGELQQKNEQIKELNKINRELLNGNQNQAYLLKGSNLRDRL